MKKFTEWAQQEITVEERISKFVNKSTEIMQTEEQREKRMKKNEQNLKEMWNTIKYTNKNRS